MSKVKIFVFTFLIPALTASAWAAFEKEETSAASCAMAGLGLASPQSTSSVFENPAWLGNSNRFAASAYYTRLFNLADLAYQAVSLEGSFSHYGRGLGATELGNSLYREQALSLGGSIPLGSLARFGLAVKGFRTRISGYGEANALGMDLGAAGYIRKDLTFGAYATNLNHPRIGKAGDDLPQSLCVGTLYRPLPMVAIGAGLEGDPRYGESMLAGTEIALGRWLFLRSGTRTNPNAFTAGFGIVSRGLGFDYSLKTHSTLGVTHGFGLVYRP